MSEADFYPAGAYKDPNAPYNQVDVPEKEFDVTCSQTLSKTVSVWTNNYIPGAEGVDYEPDDEGGCYAVGWHDPDDTSDTDWVEEYKNDHYTPLELIELYKETLKEQLKSWEGMDDTVSAKTQIRKIEHLIEECSNWTEDEIECVEE